MSSKPSKAIQGGLEVHASKFMQASSCKQVHAKKVMPVLENKSYPNFYHRQRNQEGFVWCSRKLH